MVESEGSMRILFAIYIISLLTGCATVKTTGEVIKTDKGIKFFVSGESKIKYKDNEVEAEFDSRKQSLLRTVIEGSMLKEINKR